MPIRQAIDHLRHDLRRIRTKDTFSRNAFKVFGANSAVLISQLVLTPLIARLYGPEAYGIYGLFLALVMNLHAFAELGYTNAHMLPRDDDDFHHLFRLNLLLLGSVAVLALIAALCRSWIYEALPSWKTLDEMILFVPLHLLAYSFCVFCVVWLTRVKQFGKSSMIASSGPVALRIFNLGYGFFSAGAWRGLVWGELLVSWSSVAVYRRVLRPYGWHKMFTGWSWAGIKRVALEYKRFPLLTFPERWVSQLGMQLPVFLLIGQPAVVGHFALSGSLLLIPLRMFGYTFSTVYVQKAAETVDSDPELLGRITKGLYQRLFWFGLLPFATLAFFSDEAFALILGEEWRDAGVITAYMGLFFFFRLLSEPMVALFYAQRREHTLLVFQSILTVARLAVMLALHSSGPGPALLGFSMVSALGYLILGYMLLRAAGQAATKLTLRTLLVTSIVCLLAAALRNLTLGSWLPSL